MKIFILSAIAFISLSACNYAKDKTKEAINKTGEITSTAASEFADGLEKGVKKSYKNKIEIGKNLSDKIKTGKVIINSSKGATDNILSAYIIYEEDFAGSVTAKVFDDLGNEYARTAAELKGKKNEARYTDFIFDNRTNIDGKSKIIFE